MRRPPAVLLPLRLPSLLLSATSFSRSFLFSCKKHQMTHCVPPAEADGSKDIGDDAWREKLSSEQFHVLREKGTDERFGLYDNHFAPGDYLCAACGAVLYTSEMKFHCTCGWPAFWDCIPGAVREEPDKDGQRREILCNACNSHLGHVFRGEGFSNPPPNERHCVNNTSINFRPK